MDRKTDFRTTDLFMEHAEKAAHHASRFSYERFRLQMDSLPPQMESPAEAVFWLWFYADQWDEVLFQLVPQKSVTLDGGQTYRFDFSVQVRVGDYGDMKVADLPIGIEVDGHAFHEKTLDQVSYRNERDRLLQSAGWKVFHFSFSELMRRPAKCAGEVYDAAWKEVEARGGYGRLYMDLRGAVAQAQPDAE